LWGNSSGKLYLGKKKKKSQKMSSTLVLEKKKIMTLDLKNRHPTIPVLPVVPTSLRGIA
jgi:hypothetical protein